MSEQPESPATPTPTPAAMPSKKAVAQSVPKKTPVQKTTTPSRVASAAIPTAPPSLEDHQVVVDYWIAKNAEELDQLLKRRAKYDKQSDKKIAAKRQQLNELMAQSVAPSQVQVTRPAPASVPLSPPGAVGNEEPPDENRPLSFMEPSGESESHDEGQGSPESTSPSLTDKIKNWLHKQWVKFVDANRPPAKNSEEVKDNA